MMLDCRLIICMYFTNAAENCKVVHVRLAQIDLQMGDDVAVKSPKSRTRPSNAKLSQSMFHLYE